MTSWHPPGSGFLRLQVPRATSSIVSTPQSAAPQTTPISRKSCGCRVTKPMSKDLTALRRFRRANSKSGKSSSRRPASSSIEQGLPMSRPNIILIITDQQRADTIGSLGAGWMQTPHLDRLVREGVAFTQCFATSPVCVASRASLFPGQFPHSTQVFTNFQPWEPSWVKSLSAQGYHCVSIGKMHINPYDAAGGFHQRFVVENKDRPLFLEERDRAIYDEWDKALRVRGLTKPSRFNRHASDPEGYKHALGA